MANKKKSHTDVSEESGNTNSEANQKIFTFKFVPELVLTANFASAAATGIVVSIVAIRMTGQISVACYSAMGSFAHALGANLVGYEVSLSGIKAKFGAAKIELGVLRSENCALTTKALAIRNSINGLALAI